MQGLLEEVKGVLVKAGVPEAHIASKIKRAHGELELQAPTHHFSLEKIDAALKNLLGRAVAYGITSGPKWGRVTGGRGCSILDEHNKPILGFVRRKDLKRGTYYSVLFSKAALNQREKIIEFFERYYGLNEGE